MFLVSVGCGVNAVYYWPQGQLILRCRIFAV